MTERPILFSAPMVRALLAGTKTQTRRAVKGSPVHITPFIGRDDKPTNEFGLHFTHKRVINEHVRCPYGAPGDRLWVKETWAAPHDCDHLKPTEITEATRIHPRASWDGPSGLLWRPSIFMPRWASRITLEVTGVRVERLQDISEDDAQAEGIERFNDTGLGARDGIAMHGIEGVTDTDWVEARDAFQQLWESIDGADSWAANPWVWVVEFKRVTRDSFESAKLTTGEFNEP